MEYLLGDDWWLSDSKKEKLIHLFNLTDIEQEDLFNNIEYQLKILPKPVGNKPIDSEIFSSIKQKVTELSKLISQLDSFHKKLLDNTLSQTFQTLVSIKDADNENIKFTRNILSLDTDTENTVIRNTIRNDTPPAPIAKNRLTLGKAWNVDVTKEYQSIIKTENNIPKKLSKDEYKCEAISRLDINISKSADTLLTLDYIRYEMENNTRYYSSKKKLDMLTEGLSKAFGSICFYYGDTQLPVKPDRNISPSINSKFMTFMLIVLDDINTLQSYDDLAEALKASIKRSQWYKEHKDISKQRKKRAKIQKDKNT